MAGKKFLAALAVAACAIAGYYYFISSRPPAGEPAVKDAAPEPRRLFPVAHENLWGYIDAAGELVIRPTYTYAAEFHDGFAQVLVKERWGYIDTNGTLVIAPQFEQADRFAEGLARVVLDSSVSEFPGYIDRSGKMVLRTENAEYLGNFSEGLAAISVNGKFGYIDHHGNTVIEPQFDVATGYKSGLARVAMRDGDNYRWGFIDKAGKVVIPLQFEDASDFSEGLAGVHAGELAGFIDPSGNFVIPPQFEYVGDFKEGTAPVLQIKFGYVDKTGKMVIPPQFDFAYPFSEGLARVVVDPGTGPVTGFIDPAGRFVIEAEFESAEDFSAGLARVTMGDYSGYIDSHGKYYWNLCASCNVPAAPAARP